MLGMLYVPLASLFFLCNIELIVVDVQKSLMFWVLPCYRSSSERFDVFLGIGAMLVMHHDLPQRLLDWRRRAGNMRIKLSPYFDKWLPDVCWDV